MHRDISYFCDSPLMMCDHDIGIKLLPDVKEYIRGSVCNAEIEAVEGKEKRIETFRKTLACLGQCPLFTTIRLNTLGGDVNDVADKVKEEISRQYSSKGWSPPEMKLHPQVPDLLIIRNRGPKAVTKVKRQIIVDIPCGMAVLRGADIFAQGIIGTPSALKEGQEVSCYADLDHQCHKGLSKPYQGKKLFLGNGISQVSREHLFTENNFPSGVGIRMTKPLYEAPVLSDMLPEMIFSQNLPSVVCGHVLGPKRGEIILDMCAAPGGKTTHIAALMNNQGRVVAFDKSKGKIKKITDNAKKWNLDIIEAYHMDGCKSLDSNSTTGGGPPYPPDTFDRILLDAPCSALGQRPKVKNPIKLVEVEAYPVIQRKLFSKAVELLKPGGVLVYSTCTITLQENEQMVKWALEEHSNIKLVPQSPYVGGPGMLGAGLSNEQLAMLQRFDPSSVTLHLDPSPDDQQPDEKKAKLPESEEGVASPNERTVEESENNSEIVDQCDTDDEVWTKNVDTDTIGFFIAKFMKME